MVVKGRADEGGGKRPYTSAVREEQAQRTKQRIVRAADELFRANGYARTSVKAIAGRARVAADTIYATFGTKERVLTAVIDARLAPAGDENVMDRAEALAIRDERDQRRQIALFVGDIVGVLERVREVYEMLRGAASIEPEMSVVHAEMDGYRYQNMARAVSWISANGPLRVSGDEATAYLWTLASPDVARSLMDVRGWSTDRYATWLEESLVRLLLP